MRQALRAASTRDLNLPPLDHVDWGVLDYLGWIHASGHIGYMVMPVHGQLRGLKLRRMLNPEARGRTHMCSWCHHVYRGTGTAMFSTAVAGSDGRRTIGNYICRNLDCSVRMRNLTSDPPTYMPETIELQRKIDRLERSIAVFMARAQVLSDTY
ncbi:MAG: FBP domain-containing protein [Pseudomonadota bacterium]